MVAKKSAACRADIPPMLSQEQRDALVYTPQCRQRWGERQIKGAALLLKAEDVEEFLKEFAWLKETELALQCLFDGEFDVPKAVGLLHAARRERYKARRGQDKRLASEVFKDALAIHGKKFHLVKQALGAKVITREVDEFGGPIPKLVPSDESDHCMVYFPSLGVPRSLIESMTDASSYEEEDEQEDYSDDENENDGSCESSDDSDSDDNASKCRGTEELSLNGGNPGSLTDNESDSTCVKAASTLPAIDNTRTNKPELTPGPVAQSPAAKDSNGATEASSAVSTEHSVEASPVGTRRAPPAQSERPGSGRKRHRKMLAPRRIPPSRFDS
ncbi:hypothetical protein PC121_g22394 [Phytophthora cactorum]|nr:hypothetical protein PC120_g24056 [Phytophthora cactorum]KAG3043686.1 hypothetical protein PC121_g22394 [Phytophthora cactorum]